MRRVIFALTLMTTLILFPVLARAQAGPSTESKQYPTSAGLVAELNRPGGLAEVAMAAAELEAAKPAAETPGAAAALRSTALASHAAVREFVKTQVTQNFTEAAMRQAGTLAYGMSATPVEASAPKVTHSVAVDLTPAELAEKPAVTNVVVRTIVDENGVPRDVAIAQSAGAAVDRQAIAAVSQYRFAPATLDNKATWASVSIAIRIEKQ
jgi:TonB family protein